MLYKPTSGLIAAGGFRAHPRYRGCIGHWMMREGAGITLYDSSGNNNTGTLINGPTWARGQFGPALEFAAAGDDYVSVGTRVGPTASLLLSFSFWSYLRTLGESSKGRVVDRAGVGGYSISTMDDLAPSAWAYSGGTEYFYVANTAVLNVWQHVVFTLDVPNDTVWLYINGVASGSGLITDEFTESSVETTIGNTVATTRALDGWLDELRVYTRILQPEEVEWLYREPFAEFQDIPSQKKYRQPLTVFPPRPLRSNIAVQRAANW